MLVEEFDLKRFAKLAMAKKVYIIVIMILTIIVGCLYSFIWLTPKYKSTTTLLLAQINEEKLNENTVKQSEITDLSMTSTLLEPYISIITSNKVLKNVITNLKLDFTEDELKKMLSVTEENTAMLAISVVHENAEFAEKIANEIAKVFMEQSHEIFSITNVNIIDVAEVEERPYNINHIKDIAIFTILGAFLSCGFVLLIYMLDTTIKEEEDIEVELKLPVLGLIPVFEESLEKRKDKKGKDSKKKKRKNDELVILGNTKSPVSEAFRALRTNITFAQNTKSILITSSRMEEGKSYVSANLAAAIAKTNKKVLLIDADMRKGRQSSIFNVDNQKGLSNYLAKSKETLVNVAEITKYIKTTKIPNLHIITCGTRPSNPAELLNPNKIKGLLSVLNDVYDFIIIDGTPSSIIADSIAISKLVDSTVLVVSYKSTKLEEAKRLIKSFEQVDVKLSGAVLNKYPLNKETYTTSYYYSDKSEGKLEEDEDENAKIQSVESLVNEANIKDTYINEFEEHGLTTKSYDYSLSTETNTMLEYKVEKIDQEISAIKNLLMQLAVNSKQVTSKDIELIRYDISNLNEAVNSIRENSDIKQLKDEIEEVKDFTETLLNSQKENNEKIKRFIENYYKNKKN